ncbi:MAG TPA: hypothetical protein VK628_05035 [Flavitalea sp.]|nr:hypothetical protein [Flavitalea sp.]
MSIGLTKTTYSGQIPVWQGIGKDIQLAQGGFALVTTALKDGAVLKAGSPVIFDEAARTATVLATGVSVLTSGGSDVTYRVAKGSPFTVGQYLAAGGTGGKAYAITVIDTSNADYDVLTVGTTLGVVTAGDTVYASTATGATASAYGAVNGLLYDDTIVRAGESISAVIRGTVYARRVPYHSALATALAGKIIYSQSK